MMLFEELYHMGACFKRHLWDVDVMKVFRRCPQEMMMARCFMVVGLRMVM